MNNLKALKEELYQLRKQYNKLVNNADIHTKSRSEDPQLIDECMKVLVEAKNISLQIQEVKAKIKAL